MKVIFLLGFFPKISETFIINQIVSMVKLGHEVTIFYFSDQDCSSKYNLITKYDLYSKARKIGKPSNFLLNILKTPYLFLTAFIKYPIRTLRTLNFIKNGLQVFNLKLFYCWLAFMRVKECDIIHCHFGQIGEIAIVAKRIGIPFNPAVVVSFHGWDFSAFARNKNSYRRVFTDAETITANSNFTKNKLLQLGCNSNKIIVVPESLDIESFIYKARYVSGGEVVKILTIARLVEKKGLEYSICAIKKIISDYNYRNIEYIIVGDGPLKSYLHSLVKKLDLSEYIIFKGELSFNDAVKEYDNAHIFVLPSVTASNGDQEGQGLVLQEAQACGVPVIATNHNGFSEGIIEGKTAFLVPEKDSDSLAERIIFLLKNSYLWKEMGEYGRRFVESKYDLNHVGRIIDENYKQIIKRSI